MTILNIAMNNINDNIVHDNIMNTFGPYKYNTMATTVAIVLFLQL